MHCTSCGTQIRKGAKFCPGCGEKVSNAKGEENTSKDKYSSIKRMSVKEFLASTGIEVSGKEAFYLKKLTILLWSTFFALVILTVIPEDGDSDGVVILGAISGLVYLVGYVYAWFFCGFLLLQVRQSLWNLLCLLIPILWPVLYTTIAYPLRIITGESLPPSQEEFTKGKYSNPDKGKNSNPDIHDKVRKIMGYTLLCLVLSSITFGLSLYFFQWLFS